MYFPKKLIWSSLEVIDNLHLRHATFYHIALSPLVFKRSVTGNSTPVREVGKTGDNPLARKIGIDSRWKCEWLDEIHLQC